MDLLPVGREGAAEPHSSVRPGVEDGQGAGPQAGWPDSESRTGGPGHPEKVLGGHTKTCGSQEGPGGISHSGECTQM